MFRLKDFSSTKNLKSSYKRLRATKTILKNIKLSLYKTIGRMYIKILKLINIILKVLIKLKTVS